MLPEPGREHTKSQLPHVRRTGRYEINRKKDQNTKQQPAPPGLLPPVNKVAHIDTVGGGAGRQAGRSCAGWSEQRSRRCYSFLWTTLSRNSPHIGDYMVRRLSSGGLRSQGQRLMRGRGVVTRSGTRSGVIAAPLPGGPVSVTAERVYSVLAAESALARRPAEPDWEK